MIAGSCTAAILGPATILDKPTPASAAFSALPGHAVVQLEGRDAVAFAQAQCMNDVAALDEGGWQWNGWLTPKGRVVALFAVLRPGPDTLWLLMPDGDAGELVARLGRFVFRSKVKISVRADLQVAGAFAKPVSAAGARLAGDVETGVELDMGDGSEGGARTLRIATAKAPHDASIAARWRACDIAHGWPRLPASQAEAWTPQQLSLDRLRAYSVKKGCYPGQEIVARTHFLGQAKRGLVLLGCDAPPDAGSEVLQGGRAIGTIAGSAAAAGEAGPHAALALAVLPLERGDGALQLADGAGLALLSLREGLAR